MTRKLAGLRGQPVLTAALLALVSCGGGDSTGNDAGDPVAYYSTMTYRDSRILALMVFEGGPLYGFFQIADYTVQEPPAFVYAGFFVGQLDSQPPPLSRYKGYEFDFDRKAAGPVEVTLEGLSLQSVSGSIQREIGQSDTFTASYAAAAAQRSTDTSMLAGHYTGRASQSWANDNIYVMLTSEGFEKGVFLHLFSRTR